MQEKYKDQLQAIFLATTRYTYKTRGEGDQEHDCVPSSNTNAHHLKSRMSVQDSH
jgi:hypothetical protein